MKDSRKVVTPAEAWRLAQAHECLDATAEGRDIPLDADGKIVPSKHAFDKIQEQYIVVDPGAQNN